MTALLALIRKDILIYLSNRRALLLNLAMPIVLGAFFGFLFGGSGGDSGKINIALVSQDQSEVGQKIATAIKSDKVLQVTEMSEAEARQQVEKGKLSAAIILPAGFGDTAVSSFFGGGDKPVIPIFYDPSQNTVLAMLKGVLTQHAMETVSAEAFGGKAGMKVLDDRIKDLDKVAASSPDAKSLQKLFGDVQQFRKEMESHASDPKPQDPAAAAATQRGLSVPFTTRDEALTSGPAKYNGYAHSFAGMAVQFVLFFAINAGIEVLVSRKLGIWNRLLASPVSLKTLLLARVLSASAIATCLLAAIFAAASVLFKVRVDGSMLGMVGVTISFALMTGSFGLLIAAFGKTPEAARSLSTFATLILVMLGGAWVPSFIFPQWLQTATLVVPTRWAVDGFDAMTWRGLGLEAAWGPIGVLLGFTAVFLLLAIWKFQQDSEAQA